MKKLSALHSIIAISFFASSAKAGVVLVEDSSNQSGIYMAKVISKKPIIEKVAYMATKNYCERYYGTIHYSNASVSSPIIAKTQSDSNPVCSLVTHENYYDVIKGYQVTYDFKGTLKTAILHYEPSEFVQVYNAP
jgi:hypothetical protein